jgi:chemotaxis protein methyltransferase CheR
MIELGIVETRSIISVIANKYNYDFSDYALTSLKRRLELIIDQLNIKHIDVLINKLSDDNAFFDLFIDSLSVPSSEMFRDPSFWRMMHDEIIPQLMEETCGNLKIWLPNSVSGDELYSLTILLSEMNLLDKVQIQVSSLSNKSIDNIKSGIIAQPKLEISIDNYTRANGLFELPKYLTDKGGLIFRDTSLISGVTFFKQNTFLEPMPQNIRLVLFRNKMIYYNLTLQAKVLKNLLQTIPVGGRLIIGTKESLTNVFSNNDFALISNSESIYKRRA